MGALVPGQMGLATEALAALRAGERAGAGVDCLMAYQIGFRTEAARADGTGVGAAPGVYCLVTA